MSYGHDDEAGTLCFLVVNEEILATYMETFSQEDMD
jgi:hypothetical protein